MLEGKEVATAESGRVAFEYWNLQTIQKWCVNYMYFCDSVTLNHNNPNNSHITDSSKAVTIFIVEVVQ